ncbi:MAG: dTMP kinase [Candidatus Marinimicrobia bacterium]|nr:dTMP kinase [Candidatus Neomarinimicrobiota bacterium]
MRQGLFITFEGIDGCGKTTQIDILTKRLQKKNLKYTLVREPGGTKIGEKIRKILLDNDNINMEHKTELLLYSASRYQLCKQKLLPELDAGKIVICDRFYDSTTAYQGYGRGLDIDFINSLNKFATDELVPDLTFFLDISLNEREKRIGNNKLDRLESEQNNFHQKVREGFLKINKKNRNRFVKLNGKDGIEIISKKIWNNIERKING